MLSRAASAAPRTLRRHCCCCQLQDILAGCGAQLQDGAAARAYVRALSVLCVWVFSQPHGFPFMQQRFEPNPSSAARVFGGTVASWLLQKQACKTDATACRQQCSTYHLAALAPSCGLLCGFVNGVAAWHSCWHGLSVVFVWFNRGMLLL